MINKLKRRLILVITLFVTVILAAFLVTINVVPSWQNRQAAYRYLLQVADNQLNRNPITPNMEPVPNPQPSDAVPAKRPEPMPKPRDSRNMYASSNLVVIQTNPSGEIISWNSDREDLFDRESISSLLQVILTAGKEFGMKNGYYYFLRNINDGYLFILLDSSSVFVNTRQILIWSVIAAGVVWILCVSLATLLANKLTAPLALALEKQKQFISDAGHEFKTPITVIASNADVLQSEIGENKWLSHIIVETKHMGFLTNELMSLAVIDDSEKKIEISDVNLSEIVLSAALPFESSAYEKGITIQFDVASDIICKGNENQLRQLVTILMSNAIKYGNENGKIFVSLICQKKKVFLTVYNTGEGICQDDLEKVFERFYRVDKARSRKNGGHGLGLAIARSIVERHGGSIFAESNYGEWVQFHVQLNGEIRRSTDTEQ